MKLTATSEVILIADQTRTRKELKESKCKYAENEFDGTVIFTIHDNADLVREFVNIGGFQLSSGRN